MYKRVSESVSYCLRGKILYCSLKIAFSRILKLMFLLYAFSVAYLLIYDTSFIVSIGLYENQYIAAVVCAGSTLVGFVLFAAVQWYSFSAKRILWAQMQNTEKIKTSVALVLKLIAVRFSVIAVKTVTFILSLLPSAFLFTVLYANLKNGMSDAVALVFLVGSVMLFIAGLSFALIVNQRYYLAEYCLFSGGSVKDVLLHSIYLMDFKCRKLLKCKLKHLPFKIFGIFVPQLSVIADAREFLLVTDKTIEYARKAHTQQKTVVFYCNKTTA